MKVEIAPDNWISLDLVSFMTGICGQQETGGAVEARKLDKCGTGGFKLLLRFYFGTFTSTFFFSLTDI